MGKLSRDGCDTGGLGTQGAGIGTSMHLLSGGARSVPRETQLGQATGQRGSGDTLREGILRGITGWSRGGSRGDHEEVMGEITRAAPAARKAARSSSPSKLGATTSMTRVNWSGLGLGLGLGLATTSMVIAARELSKVEVARVC